MHRAETILETIETILSGLSTTSSYVARGRVYPIDADAALSLYMGADDAMGDYGNRNMAHMDRSLTVIIRAHVKTTTGTETLLNQIRAEVYAAMMADHTLGLPGIVISSYLDADQAPDLSADSEQPTATQDMQWVVQYRHSLTSAET